MSSLVVGLAPYKTSFYDPKTNSYITLENPVVKIPYDDSTDLSGICHACNAQKPALLLYEGKFPKKTLDEWKAKYDLIGKQAKDRADLVQENSRDIEEEAGEPEVDPPKEPEESEEEDSEEDGEGNEEEQGDLFEAASVKPQAEKKTKAKKATKKAAGKPSNEKKTDVEK